MLTRPAKGLVDESNAPLLQNYQKTVWWVGRGGHQGAVASTDLPHTRIPTKRWQVDRLHARVHVDWPTLDPKIFANFFPRLYEEILFDTFNQKGSMGWHPAPHSRLVVSLLLPGSLDAVSVTRHPRSGWYRGTEALAGCSRSVGIVDVTILILMGWRLLSPYDSELCGSG